MFGAALVATPEAHAAVDDGFVSAAMIGRALDGVDDDLVREAPQSREEPRHPAEAAASGDASPGSTTDVVITAGDFSMGIDLPRSANARPAVTLDDGTIAYPSDGHSANAVVPLARGAQLLSVIADSLASETYAYDLDLPAGSRLEATDDGGARVLDKAGATTVEFEAAWARDADGKNVPTRYEVEGRTLTQVVDHRDLDRVAYPVVADPLPVIVIVITAAALIVVAAAALGVATWLVVSWWNACRAQGKYPELSTKNGFTARCVR